MTDKQLTIYFFRGLGADKRALGNILTWDNETDPDNLLHIHGTAAGSAH
jgi:hypothetical protein